MEKVYLLGGLRSHIGLAGGIFKNVPAEDLAAALLGKLKERYPESLHADGILAGNAVGTGGNITRLAALKARLPEKIPALTIDMQCASAAAAIGLAMARIGSSMADILIAGGFESSSMQPTRFYAPEDHRYSAAGFKVAQFSPDTVSSRAMLEGAERTCQKYAFTRQELDGIAVRSHRLAQEAREKGLLKDITVSLFGSVKDEGIRDRMSEKLAGRMPSLFTPEETAVLLAEHNGEQRETGGKPDRQENPIDSKQKIRPLLTAANACLTNDGAAFVILASEKFLKRTGRTAEARLLQSCEWGVDPRYSPEGALNTGDMLLKKCRLRPEQIDVFEYNEAFAVISGLFKRRYPKAFDRYCPWGGALAYGHPYGASGAILLLHLWQELKQRKGRYGILSIAGAGGVGTAIALERV